MKYFAYGSNLSTEQMKDRDVVYSESRIAILEGWKLIFPVYSYGWGGGVADIIVAGDDDIVEGAIYETDQKGLRQLDHYEGRQTQSGVEVGLYRRQYIWVRSEQDAEKVLTYIVNHTDGYKESNDHPPSDKYLNTIVRGAESHGLSQDYIRWLKSISTQP